MALLASTILIAITLLVVVPSSLVDANFISQVCSAVREHPNCMEVPSSDPRSVNATTRVELESISLHICTATARDGFKTIEEEEAKRDEMLGFGARSRDEKLGLALDMCSACTYGLWQPRLRRSGMKDWGGQFAGENCEKAFTNQGVKSVMTQMNKRMGIGATSHSSL
ncbi:hypothetical protein VPH35_056975 [Triticum aestivum]